MVVLYVMSYNEAQRYWHFGGICHLQITLQIAAGSSDMFVPNYMTTRQKKKL
jgi:hypothetical protein